jgi:hypothetical protein
MKRAGIVAAGVALAASTVIATPTFGATKDPCTVLQNQLNTLELRLAHQGINSRRGSRIEGKIHDLEQTAKFLGCKIKVK